jgi:Ca-activated chloride channel family protein
LRDIASVTGGRYFRATDREALRQIFQQIDRLEKTASEPSRYLRLEEEYRPFLIVGLSALFLELVLSATVAVRVP